MLFFRQTLKTGFEHSPALGKHLSTTPPATTAPCSEEGKGWVGYGALTEDGTSLQESGGKNHMGTEGPGRTPGWQTIPSAPATPLTVPPHVSPLLQA